MKVNDQVINKLFWWMRNHYGSRWVLIFGSAEQIESGKAAWLVKLSRFNAGDIAKTLEHVLVIHPSKPPDIDNFVKLLKHLKGHRPGHLSNNEWQSRTEELKANKAKLDAGQEYLRKIKQESGL